MERVTKQGVMWALFALICLAALRTSIEHFSIFIQNHFGRYQEESALQNLCQTKLQVINKICVVGQQGVSGNCPTAMEEEREVCAVCMGTGILNLETMGGGKEEDSWRKWETCRVLVRWVRWAAVWQLKAEDTSSIIFCSPWTQINVHTLTRIKSSSLCLAVC